LDWRGAVRAGAAAARRTVPPPELVLCSVVQAENTATSVTAVETEVAKKMKTNPCPFKLDILFLFYYYYIIINCGYVHCTYVCISIIGLLFEKLNIL